MSPVTGLAGLPGRILSVVHMRNVSPVDRDGIQETKAKCMAPHKLVSFAIIIALSVDSSSCNFSNKASSNTFQVGMHTRQN